MRVLMLEPPPELIEDRHRKGLDRFDEVWDGVLHMVPPPSHWHQKIERELLKVLEPWLASGAWTTCTRQGSTAAIRTIACRT